MSEHFCTLIEIGGTIKRKQLPKLIAAMQADGIGIHYCEATAEAIRQEAEKCHREGWALQASGTEVTWGNLENTEAFCKKHKLQFNKRTEGRYEYNGAISWWRPGMKTNKTWSETNKDATVVMLSLANLTKAKAQGKTLQKIVKELEAVAPPTVLQIIN